MINHKFIHLRNHTSYSLCEGTIRIKDLIKKALDYKMPATVICDTHNMFGALEFSMACQKNNIQPIIACQIFFDADNKSENKNLSNIEIEKNLCESVLIAKDDAGYQNLMQLVSNSYLKRKQGIRPHITVAELEKKNSGLIFLCGGSSGAFSHDLANKQNDKADKLAQKLKSIFQEDFYIEIQRHEEEIDSEIEPKLIDLAFKHNIPLVATNKNLFLSRDMHEAQDILYCIGTGRYVSEKNRKKISEEHYFKSPDRMIKLFEDIPEAIENTINIAKKCHVMSFERPPTLPKFQTKDNLSEAEQLEIEGKSGLKERLELKFELESIKKADRPKIIEQYNARLDYELGIIKQMNFSGYFLIVSDFIIWSKENDIPVGPGRGSGAGSIIAWALKITDLDPIRFGLLFERFLNPERVSMPDFDIDFCQSRRDEVISYVQDKYGHDMVAQIITFGKLQARAVLKDVGRVLQMPYNQVDRICKLIPFNAIEAVTLQKAIEMDKDLRDSIKQDPAITKLVNIALKLEGLYRHTSTHAAGIVIGDKPLDQICALHLDDSKSTMPAAGYSMKYIEAAGLVKFDFLGLKTLTVISDAVKLVNKNRNLGLDINKIRLDDAYTFKMLAQGDSIGCFQI